MKLSDKAQEIDNKNWYFEYPDGIEIGHDVWHRGSLEDTHYIKIPWKMLRASLKRRDQKE